MYGCFPDPTDARDIPLSGFIDSGAPMPTNVSYLGYTDEIEDQKAVPACVGFGVTATKEAHDKFHNEFTKLSAIWLYDRAKHLDDEPYAGGTYIRMAMKILANEGAAPHFMVPYDDEYHYGKFESLVIPPEVLRPFRIKTYARLTGIEEMCRCLSQHGPFAMGIKVTNEFECCIGNEWVPVHYKSVNGGHCIAVVGYSLVEETFTIVNSWGQIWGKGGIAKIPFEYWQRFGMDAWGIVDISPNEA